MERRAPLGRYRRTAGPLTVRRNPIQDRYHHRAGPRVAVPSGRRVPDHSGGRTEGAHALQLLFGKLRGCEQISPSAGAGEGWFSALLRLLAVAIISEITFQLPGTKGPPH